MKVIYVYRWYFTWTQIKMFKFKKKKPEGEPLPIYFETWPKNNSFRSGYRFIFPLFLLIDGAFTDICSPGTKWFNMLCFWDKLKHFKEVIEKMKLTLHMIIDIKGSVLLLHDHITQYTCMDNGIPHQITGVLLESFQCFGNCKSFSFFEV